MCDPQTWQISVTGDPDNNRQITIVVNGGATYTRLVSGTNTILAFDEETIDDNVLWNGLTILNTIDSTPLKIPCCVNLQTIFIGPLLGSIFLVTNVNSPNLLSPSLNNNV